MTAPALTLPQPRGACPGLSAPMATGDGLLVRLLPIGTIALDAFAGMCAAARQHGNGIIEVTSRGSIQIRGLSAASAPRFAAAIAALGIAAGDGIPVLTGPLADLTPDEIIDTTALAADLRVALAQNSLAQRLSAKVSVAIDGGGSLSLDDISADVRLRAETVNGVAALYVSVGGNCRSAIPLGCIAGRDGVEVTTHLLEIIARRGRHARARDIVAAEGIAVFRSAVEDLLVASAQPCVHENERNEPIGPYPLRDGTFAYGVGLAFGHANAMSLQRLTEAASAAGARGMRAAPGRALMIVGLTQQTASSFCRRGRSARLYRACRRSAAACHCLRRRADLRVGGHRRARPCATDRRGRRAASRRLVQDSCFRLRQGLRASGAGGADHRRYFRGMRAH